MRNPATRAHGGSDNQLRTGHTGGCHRYGFCQGIRKGKSRPSITQDCLLWSPWRGEHLALRPPTNRRQAVTVEGESSAFVPVRSGVPQGSVIGPVLFLLYINDLPEQVESDTRLFADDTLLLRTITKAEDQEILQNDLHQLEKWEKAWDMSFHPQKCNVLTISTSRSKEQKHHDYTLHDHVLQKVSTVKYLGLTIQSDSKWNTHINNTCAKANRTLGFLRRNLRIGSESIKATAIKALVRPLLEYASSVWDPHQKQQIDQIEAIQRRAARFCLNRYRRTASVSEMLEHLKWHSLKDRRKSARLGMFYKIHHGLASVKFPNLRRQTRTGRSHSLAYHTIYGRTDYRKNSFVPRTIQGLEFSRSKFSHCSHSRDIPLEGAAIPLSCVRASKGMLRVVVGGNLFPSSCHPLWQDFFFLLLSFFISLSL